MSIIYRKTEKGHSEIKTRANRLAQRLRAALILIDGKTTDDDLRRMILGDAEEVLQTLLDMDYIEVTSVSREMPITPEVAKSRKAPAENAPTSPVTFQTRRLQALRFLNDQLGPEAESLAIRIEKTKNWDECRPVLLLAQQAISRSRGDSVGLEFASRFIDNPQNR
ncbi:MAG: hypothetical protein HEQ39_02415 [Rhizobacter sp.]